MPKPQPRHFELETVGPVPDWWAPLFVRRQIEIRRRVKMILRASGPQNRMRFVRQFGEFERREVDHALYLLVGDLVVVRDGDLYRLRDVAAKGA
jgi:hypothetical protein